MHETQSEIMMKGYERMERKNTRFKKQTSNVSGSDSGHHKSKGTGPDSMSRSMK